MTPQITTVLLTYKRPQLLKRAIQSVLNQTYQDYIVWVYDNASHDGTADVVAEFMKRDSRVRYHCHDENLGSAGNFLYGWNRVDTPFFHILCDDDYLLPTFFETAVKGFKQYPQAIFSAGATFVTDDDGRIVFAPLYHWPPDTLHCPPFGMLRMLEDGEFPSMTGTLYRREVKRANVLNLKAGMVGDFCMALLLSAQHPIYVSKVPVAVNTTHPTAISFRQPVSYFYPSYLTIIQSLKNLDCLSPEVLRIAEFKLQRSLRVFLVQILLRSALSGDWEVVQHVSSIFSNDLRFPFLQALSDFSAVKLKTILRHRLQRCLFYEKKFRDQVREPLCT